MKPITISPTYIARELGYLAACFFVALGANIFAIIHFHRPASEIFSQIGFVIVITAALYAYILILRLIYNAIRFGWSRISAHFKK